MEKCFICFTNINDNGFYLPFNEDYINQEVSIFKNTFIIKTCKPFEFLFYCICNICLDEYINIRNKNIFKYLKQREIGIK